MDALLTEIIQEALNGEPPRRRRNAEDDASDLNRFLRPGDSVEQNIRLLEYIRLIESERHTYDVRRRQLRIMSDMMEDYQYNMQLFLRYISTNMRHNDAGHRSRAPRAQQQQQHVPRPTPASPSPSPNTGLIDAQMELGTRTLVYDASQNETRCPISLDDFSVGEEIVQIVGCGHVFKCVPLREWFRRNTHCPVCRYNVITTSGHVRARRASLRDNTYLQGNAHTSRGNVYTTGGPTESYSTGLGGGTSGNASDMWTTLLSGLITSTPTTGTYTFSRDLVIPVQFDAIDEVD